MSTTATKPKKRIPLGLQGLSDEQRRIINAEDPPLPGEAKKAPVGSPAVEQSAAAPKPQSTLTVVEQADESAKQVSKEDAEPKKRRRQNRASSEQREVAQSPHDPLLSQSFRIPESTLAALMRVSMERKIQKIKPFTQQDIVAEALQQWLEKEGSL